MFDDDYLNDLYERVNVTGPDLEIQVQYVEEMQNRGSCILKKKENIPYLEITIRNDSRNKIVISHELYHAYLTKKGFGLTRAVNKYNGIYKLICELLHSVIEHQVIFLLQQNDGIDLDTVFLDKSNRCFPKCEKEEPVSLGTVISALRLTEVMLGGIMYRDNYEERMKSKFPKTYELSSLIYNRICSDIIKTARDFRICFIECLKLCDAYLINEASTFQEKDKLSKNISISYIVRNHEKDNPASSVFRIRPIGNSKIIFTKGENVASYVIEYIERADLLDNISVQDLVSSMDGIVSYS